jgi:hypothetical protein
MFERHPRLNVPGSAQRGHAGFLWCRSWPVGRLIRHKCQCWVQAVRDGALDSRGKTGTNRVATVHGTFVEFGRFVPLGRL